MDVQIPISMIHTKNITIFTLVSNLNTSDSVFLDPIVSVIFNKSCKHLKNDLLSYSWVIDNVIL